MDQTPYIYDVAVSYASEDRQRVGDVVAHLTAFGARIYYDERERVGGWGKDLASLLRDVYGQLSRYCLIFSSASYLQKDIPQEELRIILERSFRTRKNLLLTISLDGSVPPELQHLVWIDASNQSSDKLADMIRERTAMVTAKTIDPPYYPIVFVGDSFIGLGDSSGNDTPFLQDPPPELTQRWTGDLARRRIDPPAYRLSRDFGYRLVDRENDWGEPIPAKSIVIFRSEGLDSQRGGSSLPPLEMVAHELGDLICWLKDRICGDDPEDRKDFRVYLVGHSLGGLICRCLVQNRRVTSPEVVACVDKVFTYATPHNGIPSKVVSGTAGVFSPHVIDMFRGSTLAASLSLANGVARVDTLNGKYPAERFFTLIGTDFDHYEHIPTRVKRLIGPTSDGLVRISDASVQGSPRAFVHRSHDGSHGIVQSDEGYRNLVRFLFGNIRLTGTLQVREISLPPPLEKALQTGRAIRNSYSIEVVARVRGSRTPLHERRTDHWSAVFRTFDDLVPSEQALRKRRNVLFSLFLSSHFANSRKRTLGCSIDLAIPHPAYEVDGVEWDEATGYLYREMINLDVRPRPGTRSFELTYGYDSIAPGRSTRKAENLGPADGSAFRIPLNYGKRSVLTADLIVEVAEWQ